MTAVGRTRRGPRDHVVCREDELGPGAMKLVALGKFGIGVYNVDGELFAITNYCPHQGAPLCLGRVQGTTVEDPSVPGRTGYVMRGRIVRCPWHQWEFDITTAKTLASPQKGIRTYEVRVQDGDVILTR